MQATAIQGLRINARHPDADVALCLSLGDKMGNTGTGIIRSADPHHYKLDTTGGGNIARGNGKHGIGFKCLVASTLKTQVALPAWTEGLSWMIQYNQDQTGGFPREIFEVGGLIFMTEIAKQVSFYNVAGTLLANSTTTLNLGQEYSLGIRYVKASGTVSFFIDGKREDVTGVAAQTATSTIWQYGVGGTFRNSGTFNLLRDVRVYNRPLPDSAFQRYYRDPNSFYFSSPRPTLLVAPSGAAGRFLPFMRPHFSF